MVNLFFLKKLFTPIVLTVNHICKIIETNQMCVENVDIKSFLNTERFTLSNIIIHKTLNFLILQGLFACVGSGDPVRVLCLFHNKYTGYCCIHLLCTAMYNLSLPRLSANYYGLPTTVQLWAAHESQCSLFGVSRSTAQVLYCTVPVLNHIIMGPFSPPFAGEPLRGN